MAGSIVEVWNIALGYCGHFSTVSAINENSSEANICRTFFSSCLKSELSISKWDFSVKRSKLSLIYDGFSSDNNIAQDYRFIYAYPADCLAPLYILQDYTDLNKNEHYLKYKRQSLNTISFDTKIINVSDYVDDLSNSNNNKKVIFTDKENPILEYNFYQEDVSLWSPLFVDLVSLSLAMRIANPLKMDNGQTMAAISKQYQYVLNNALAINSHSYKNDPILTTDSVYSRVRNL
jgi:hypothetical protein